MLKSMAKSKIKLQIFRDACGKFYIFDEEGNRRMLSLRELNHIREKEKAEEKAEATKRLLAIGGEY
jgi:hypothetical protein